MDPETTRRDAMTSSCPRRLTAGAFAPPTPSQNGAKVARKETRVAILSRIFDKLPALIDLSLGYLTGRLNCRQSGQERWGGGLPAYLSLSLDDPHEKPWRPAGCSESCTGVQAPRLSSAHHQHVRLHRCYGAAMGQRGFERLNGEKLVRLQPLTRVALASDSICRSWDASSPLHDDRLGWKAASNRTSRTETYIGLVLQTAMLHRLTPHHPFKPNCRPPTASPAARLSSLT
jgi:hypothetical protein